MADAYIKARTNIDYVSMHTRTLEIINNNKWDKVNKRIQY